MGGRLDATNIVTPLVSVITNIQRDHQQWLGNTTEEIAAEKAGIIKSGVPVLTGTEPGPALEVIRGTAERLKAVFIHVRRGDEFARQFDEILRELPLAGEHQVMNATLALAVLCILSEKFPISADAVPRGIRGVQWPGRFQVVQRREGKFVLDGAHNVDGAKTLSEALKREFPGIAVTLILGLFKDKEWREMCDTLVTHAARLFLVPVSSERTVDPGEAQRYCAEKWPSLEICAFANLAEAIAASESDGVVVIAGSLHLIGEAMEVLHVSTAARSERGLNEWNAANTPMR
jgi:dihydrofolate synthase/folylpolyglutamate synthase